MNHTWTSGEYAQMRQIPLQAIIGTHMLTPAKQKSAEYIRHAMVTTIKWDQWAHTYNYPPQSHFLTSFCKEQSPVN